MDYKAIKAELFKMCEAYPDKQVLKLRNPNNCLIPISFLVENEEPYFIVDVAAISCFGKNQPKSPFAFISIRTQFQETIATACSRTLTWTLYATR